MAGARAARNRWDQSGYLAAIRAIMSGAQNVAQIEMQSGENIRASLTGLGQTIGRKREDKANRAERAEARRITEQNQSRDDERSKAHLQLAQDQFKFQQDKAMLGMTEQRRNEIDQRIAALTLQAKASETAGMEPNETTQAELRQLQSRRAVADQGVQAIRSRLIPMATQNPAAAGPQVPVYQEVTPPGDARARVLVNEADPRIALDKTDQGIAFAEAAKRNATKDSDYIEALGLETTLKDRRRKLQRRIEEQEAQEEQERAERQRALIAEQKAQEELRETLESRNKDAAKERDKWKDRTWNLRQKKKEDEEREARKAGEVDPLASEKRSAEAITTHVRRSFERSDDSPISLETFGSQMLESALRSPKGYIAPEVERVIRDELFRREDEGTPWVNEEESGAGAADADAEIAEYERRLSRELTEEEKEIIRQDHNHAR